MTTKQTFITVPTQAAKNLEIGDEITIEEETYEVASILQNKEIDGAEVELIQEDDAQTTINLGEEIESGLGISDEAAEEAERRIRKEKEFMEELEKQIEENLDELGI